MKKLSIARNYFTFLSGPCDEDEGEEQWHGGEVENEESSVDSCGQEAGLPSVLSTDEVQIQNILQLLQLLQDQQQRVTLSGLNAVVNLQTSGVMTGIMNAFMSQARWTQPPSLLSATSLILWMV